MTREDEINTVHGNGTHLMILGAGASLASTLRNSEKNGKLLPLMWNIVEIVGLNSVVDSLPQDYKELRQDFEKLYSKINTEDRFPIQKAEIEKAVYSYFESLELPDEPTIYDYMILAMRHRKDTIATFNWDPFLYKAYLRNSNFTPSPGILFLHGNVSIGYDASDDSSGLAGWRSKFTGNLFEPTKLLYPVENKDYNSDSYIRGQWETLGDILKVSERVTIFGYSAPKSDVEAIDLLQNAWGSVEDRTMEEFELIDVRKEEDVRKAWREFIHTHHYNYATDYFDSSLAYHPRRSVESYHLWYRPRVIEHAFQDGNLVPQNFKSLDELWEWHQPLIDAENKFYN